MSLVTDEWLIDKSNDRYRTTLWVFNHSAGVVRLSTLGYAPLTPGPFAELPEDSNSTTEFGLDLNVGFGSVTAIDELDEGWKDYQWKGHTAQKYFGDIRWEFADFEQVGEMIVDGCSFQGDKTYVFSFTDYGYKLEEPVHSEVDANGDTQLIWWGSVFNVKPQIVDDFYLEYRYSTPTTGVTRTITALRDMAQSLVLDVTNTNPARAVDVDLDHNGASAPGIITFRAGHNPAGEIRFDATCSENTAAEIIQDIATLNGLGTVTTTNFGTSQNRGQQLVIDNTTSMNSAFKSLMDGIGGNHILDGTGNIELIVPDETASPKRLTEDEIIGNVTQSGNLPAYNTVVVNYAENAHPLAQADLYATISDTDRILYTTQYKSLSATTGADTGELNSTLTIDSKIVSQLDAQDLLDDLTAAYDTEQDMFSFEVNDFANVLKLACGVTIEHEDLTDSAIIENIVINDDNDYSEVEVRIV